MTVPVLAVGDLMTAAIENQIAGFINTTSAFVRTGARATTTAAQTTPLATLTTLTNNGSVWTATEDSGGYVSASAGSSTPITIPAGADGLYAVGFDVRMAGTATNRGLCNVRLNGSIAVAYRVVFTGDSVGTLGTVLGLSAGDTLGLSVLTDPAGSVSIGSDIWCYRLGI